MRTYFLLAIIIVFCFKGLMAQNNNYYCSQLTINEGLSHNTIECIFKDSEGFIWFGTHSGLNRYDGTHIVSYNPNRNDEFGLHGSRVISINEDAQGYLWVGTTANGVSKFDKKSERFYNYRSDGSANSLPNNGVSNIKVLSDNSVWFCTNNGLARYNEQKDNFIHYPFKHGLEEDPGFVVYDLIETSRGEIYVASSHDCIYKLSQQNGTYTQVPYLRDPNLRGNYRKHLFEDYKGQIWISAFSHGLIRLNPSTGESKLYNSNNSNFASNLLYGNGAMHKNKLWLSTDGDGIVVVDLETEEFSHISTDINSPIHLFSDKIYSLFIDDQDIVWVGTFNEGVNVLNPNRAKFGTLRLANSQILSFEGISVLSVFEDSKQRLWLGTDGEGLFCYKINGEVSHYKHNPNNANSLSSDRIVSIAEAPNGDILVGSYMGGLVVFNVDKNIFKRYLPNENGNSISSNHVWEIFVDSKSRVWLGLLGTGLDLFDIKNETFVSYGPRTDNYNRINHDNVMGIVEDKNGDIWFGTEGMGLNVLDNETGQMFRTIHSSENMKLSNNNIRCVFEDKDGILWIGTENGGLNRFDKRKETVDYYSMDDGLPSNLIYSITEDDNDCLWIGSAYGISKFDKQSTTFTNFDVKDGLLGFVCNREGLIKRSDGSILVGTTNGLNVFNPNEIRNIDFLPDAFFTNLRIQNEIVKKGDEVNGRRVLKNPIEYTSHITIKPQDKIFTLEFAAKTYTLPNKCWFKYKLEGFEDNWMTTEASRQHVTYSNLNPGTYKFRVRASNSDGIWSSNETVLNITVLPSFWQSIWFKLIILLTLLIVFYAWYRLKILEKEKQFKYEKEQQEQKIVHLEKESLETELNNQTFNILSRNKLLLKHKRRLSALTKKVDDKTAKTLEDIIGDIDKEVSNEKEWKHIEPRLDKVYNNFMTTLKSKHNKLTQNELRVAAYVRMGLSTKEISELLQKTTKAIDNERYRLRKKLDIPLNDSLKKYLLDL